MVAESILITGCNRGIGFEFVKQLATLDEGPSHIFACCREPNEAHALQLLAAEYDHVHVLELDVTRKDTVERARAFVEEIVGDKGLNVLFNNAAMKYWNETDIESVTLEQLRETYEVNAVGPLLLTQTFLPLLRRAALLSSRKDLAISRAAVLNMSTMVASISDNTMGRCYSYRMSKTALNMLTKTLSIELEADAILVVALHPGWVKTRMGGPGAKITTSECVDTMLSLFQTLNITHHGNFYNLYGKSIQW